ncbi:MAG: O-antigen translocase [Nonlabens sp.]
MRGLLNRINKNVLLKVASYNSVWVLIRIATGAVMSRILADYVGPAGLTILGNLRDFVQGIGVLSVLGLNNGLVKKASEHREDPGRVTTLFTTGWTISLFTSLIIGICIYTSAAWLNAQLVVTANYQIVFEVFAITLPFYVVFVMITSLLQGYELYHRFITLNILASLLAFGLSVYLTITFATLGALYALISVPVIQIFIAVFFVRTLNHQTPLRISQLFKLKIDGGSLKVLLGYSALALFSAIVIPLVTIIVRDYLRSTLDDTTTGYWEAMTRISSYYMMFATSLISMYVLPRLSRDDGYLNYRQTTTHFYRTILPLVAVGMVVVYFSRELLIGQLFNSEFYPVLPLFKWQLLGDFIKICCLVLAFRFIAVNSIKKYLIAEVLSLLSFLAFSYYFINRYGIEGVVMAHLANYVFYAMVLLWLLRKELFASIPDSVE